MNAQPEPHAGGQHQVPYILDWTDSAGDAQGAHTALLQCIAKVYAWTLTDPAHATPDGWAQALEHLPFIAGGGLQNVSYNGAGTDVAKQTFLGAVLDAAEASRASEPEVTSILGSSPGPGTTHVIDLVATSNGRSWISQLVVTTTAQEQAPGQPPVWRLNLTTRRFPFNWPAGGQDAAARAQWDQFMAGVSASTTTALPTYHLLHLAA